MQTIPEQAGFKGDVCSDSSGWTSTSLCLVWVFFFLTHWVKVKQSTLCGRGKQ